MEAHGPDLTGLAVTMAVAVLAGFALRRLRQPPLVGYILAGILLGPSGVGFVQDSENVRTLAELGVILLLFLIGMELSLKAFVRVLRPATLVVVGQIAASLAISFAFGWALAWPLSQSLTIGFIVALSSTAVAITILDQIGELRGPVGQITIGVMIAQDIAVVPILIFVESLGGAGENVGLVAVKVVFAVGVLGALIWWLARRGKLVLPFTGQVTGKVDLEVLSALAFCFAAASVTGVLGLSPAFGAFCAGLVIGGSTLRSELIRASEPIQALLLVIFFLSIGLLIDLTYIGEHSGRVLLLTIAALLLKSVLNVVLLKAVGEPWDRALQAGLIMAQIGEFSFILAASGVVVGALTPDGHRLAIAVIAATLLLSPLWADAVRRANAMAGRGAENLRAALKELYAGELTLIEKGAAPVGRRLRDTPRLLQAAARVWRRDRRQNEPESSTTPPADPPPDPPIDSPQAPERQDPTPAKKAD